MYSKINIEYVANSNTRFIFQKTIKMKFILYTLLILSLAVSDGCSNIVECSSESEGVQYVDQLQSSIKDVSDILMKTVFPS